MTLTRKEFKYSLIKKIVTATSRSIIFNTPSSASGFHLKYNSNNNYNFMLFFQHKKEGVFLYIKTTGEVYFRGRLLYPHSIDEIKELDKTLIHANEEYTEEELNEVVNEFKVLYKMYSSYLKKPNYDKFSEISTLP